MTKLKTNTKPISSQNKSDKSREKKNPNAEFKAQMKAFEKGCKRYQNALQELSKC